jgi:hypothetical protein
MKAGARAPAVTARPAFLRKLRREIPAVEEDEGVESVIGAP